MNHQDNLFKHCGYCGAFLVDSPEQDEDYRCNGCSRVTHNNPRGAAGVLIFKPGHVLLSVRGIEPSKGTLDSIGGFLKHMEQPEEGARREFLEETGHEIKNLRLIGAATHSYTYMMSVMALMYSAELVNPNAEMVPHDDVAELLWVPIEDVNESKFGAPKQVPLILAGYEKWLSGVS